MNIKISNEGVALTAKLFGEIDHHCSEEIRRTIDAAVMSEQPRVLILDLGGVSFMDSSGLGVVLGRYKLICSKGGKLRIINAPVRIERILKMAGIYTLIERAKGGEAI